MSTEDLTAELNHIMQLASTDPEDLEPLLDFGLDWLMRLDNFDLVAVFLLHSDHLVVKAAKGRLADERVKSHALSLARFPSIKETLQTCGPRVYDHHDHSEGDGDPFDGVLDFPHGHACMIVPLCFGGTPMGILSFDRQHCGVFEAQTVAMVEIYAQILGLAFHMAEQKRLLHRLMHESNERERLLRRESGPIEMLSPLDSANPGVRAMGDQMRRVAPTPTPVLIGGETGTGKEGIAELIHQWSDRRQKPLVKLNCAAIPENLLESELFGIVKGAFSGAVRDRPGRFRVANGGTLFLDELGELPLALQAKLLRVLQDGSFEPVGGDRTIKVDVRLIGATNVDLKQACDKGLFRHDLYYRLNVFPLTLPPLRERVEDLPALCEVLLKRLGLRLGKSDLVLSTEAAAMLKNYGWPGNIRELANLLERAIITGSGRVITPQHFDMPSQVKPHADKSKGNGEDTTGLTLEAVQKRHIRATLEQVGGKIYGPGGAAQLLGLKPSTLQSRMKKLGLSRQVHVDESPS